MAAVAVCEAILTAHAGDSSRLNILLIVSEDTSPHFGCYGDATVPTPRIDRLAAEGVRFDRAYTTTASCSESRSSILTGLYPHQNGQIGLATHRYRMYRDWPNAASLLKHAGYRTGILGKLHVNPESAFPFDFRSRPAQFNSFEHRDVRKIADAARQFIDQSAEPFFLMVNYPDTHLPYLNQQNGLPRQPLSADDVRVFPFVGLDAPAMRGDVAGYYNCLSRLDTGVGMLLDELTAAGRAANTLVIYLGDHGCQFPRGKLTSYEPGLRIPLLIRWPGAAQRSAARSELVSTVDLLPTILEAAGVAAPEHLAGRSLAPLIRGEAPAWRQYVCTEYHSHIPPIYFPQRSARDERYKLIVSLLNDRPNPVAPIYFSPQTWWATATAADLAVAAPETRVAVATWTDAKVELYDLRHDPYELRNLAGQPEMAAIEQRLQAGLRQWREETRDPLLDPERLARLTAEQDAAARSYPQYAPDFTWKYADYLDFK
jgi:N-sulfoglucosamine sulfohydrolase